MFDTMTSIAGMAMSANSSESFTVGVVSQPCSQVGLMRGNASFIIKTSKR